MHNFGTGKKNADAGWRLLIKKHLAYLRGTIDQCLVFTRPGIASHDHNHLWGWVDADYAGCQDTRRSYTGYVLMLNGAAMSWRSKRQATVSVPSVESEFIAASQCGLEVVYLVTFRF